MILLFHFLCLLAQYFFSNFSNSTSKYKVEIKIIQGSKSEGNEKNVSSGKKSSVKQSIYKNCILKFFPPVYVQRYEAVALILEEFASKGKVQKVVDFGCAELGFFMYLKNIREIKEILEIDIDAEKLKRFSYKAAPLTSDYLMYKWTKPLDVYVLAGNIADYDDFLAGTDAVIGIEIIEHLDEETLNKIPYNIFHNIKPKLAIFTTPNAEFNSLFPNPSDLRHDDHKFEWTRKEFFFWTQDIINEYPEYCVKFYGIGAGPDGTENLGCCTQMAVFQMLDETEIFNSAREKFDGIHNYELLNHFKYPEFKDCRTTEEKLIHEIQYQIACCFSLPDFYNYEENECEIPLSLIKEYVEDFCKTEEELRDILEKNGMKVIMKENKWFLIQSEEFNSSDNSFQENDDNDDFNNNLDLNFDKEDSICNESWDLRENCFQTEGANTFFTARNLDDDINEESQYYF